MKLNILKRNSILSLLLSISLLSGCAFPGSPVRMAHSDMAGQQTAVETSAAFHSFLDKLFCTDVASNTINLHFTLANPENFGITETPITLGSVSATSAAQSNAALENTLSALTSYDYASLSKKEQLTYDILEDYLKTQLSAADLTLYDEILRPSTGIQSQLPVLYEEYKFYTEKDVRDYLKLISLTGNYFKQIVRFEQHKAKAGLFMSDFACQAIISQCTSFAANPEEHYLINTFNHKIDNLSGLSDDARQKYKEENASVIQTQVLPAYQELASALTGLLGSGKNEMGLCYLPKGTDFYHYLVYYSTGCSSTPSELRTMIEQKRNRDLSDAAALIKADPGLWETCRSISLDGMDSVTALNTLQEKMLDQFPKAPDTSFTVSPIDECMEDYMAPAFYITAPIDNYDSNSIFINSKTDTSTLKYFTTLAHEGFPGHLYQTVMSYDSGMEPVRATLNYPGYVEGWATYVEMISYQYAGLNENAASLMELNQSAMLSLYAETDIGIHDEGWSFDDMLAFWSEYGISDQDTLREVYELIVEEPAHYLKYYIGYLEFLRLKELAKEKYKDSYSDVAFHQAILAIGPAPFDIVEKYLDNFYLK